MKKMNLDCNRKRISLKYGKLWIKMNLDCNRRQCYWTRASYCGHKWILTVTERKLHGFRNTNINKRTQLLSALCTYINKQFCILALSSLYIYKTKQFCILALSPWHLNKPRNNATSSRLLTFEPKWQDKHQIFMCCSYIDVASVYHYPCCVPRAKLSARWLIQISRADNWPKVCS